MKKQLRKHQKEALEVIKNNNKGIVQLPTGTGKTMIESYSIIDSINELKDNDFKNSIPVFVILSPRIMLSNQIYSEVKQFLVSEKIDTQELIVHSGRTVQEEYDYTEKLPFREFTNTTSIHQISESYKRALDEKVPLIIIGTYHSAPRIVQSSIPLSMVICDEAHYLISEQFNKLVKSNKEKINSRRIYFFTATLKVTDSDEGMGMNNRNIFGDIIYTKTPLEMIQSGEMIKPRLHLVDEENNDDVDEISKDVNAIIESYQEHRSLLHTAAKLLVVTKGSEHLNSIVKHDRMQQLLRRSPNLKIFDISSAYAPRINGNIVKRDEFLRSLKELKDHEEAIIFHINILTEGIDVPGITGVMFLNNMKLSKFLQSLGRSTRLHENDRKRLYNKEIKWNDHEEFTKPYAWVIVPTYGDIGEDLKSQISDTIYALRNFGFDAKEDVVIKQKRGQTLPKPIDTVNELDTRAKSLFNIAVDVTHEIESKEEAEKLWIKEQNIKKESFNDLLNVFKNE
ncbi:MAG: DEAD/DEAH box helicase [Nanoarchaeota archaeon]